MNFEQFIDEQLNEDAKSAMQAAHAAHQKEVESINALHDGEDRKKRLVAAKKSHEARKSQIRRNLQTR